MSEAPYMIDASALSEEADIWFALPAGFLPLPMRELTQAGEGPTPSDTLRPLLDSFPDDAARQRFVTELGPVLRLARLLLEAGTIHCCLGLHADDEGDGGLLLSLFTLAWRAADWAPRSVLAARAVTCTEDAEHIEALDLPCGPASLVQTRLTGPPGTGLAAGRQLLQITTYVPCPDGRRIAILTLATTAVGKAGHYRVVLRQIAETVSFDNPLQDAPDED